MITEFTGELLFHPAPLEYSANKCNNGCIYCFANNKSVKFESKIHLAAKRLKNPDRDTLMGELLYQKYPICISNRTDPFAKANMLDTKALFEYLNIIDNGVFIQTKGGNIEEIINIIKNKNKIVVYITITTLNESIAKRVEPSAPSIKQRLELASELKKLNIPVIIAINPLTSQWMPLSDLEIFAEKMKELNIKNIAIQNLHLNPNAIKSFSPEKLKAFGIENINTYYRKNSETRKHCINTIEYLRMQGLNPLTMGYPRYTDFFTEIKEKLVKIFPLNHDFFNHVIKSDKTEFCFEDFYNSIVTDKELFERQFKNSLTGYIFKTDMFTYAKIAKSKPTTLKEILKIYWNTKKIKSSPQNNLLFEKNIILENQDGIVINKIKNINFEDLKLNP